MEERERHMFDESHAKRQRAYEGHDDHNGPDDGVKHDVADAQHDVADAQHDVADAQHDIANAAPAPGSLFRIYIMGYSIAILSHL